MLQIEEFMRELFLARIAEEKQILANRVGYRRRFFVADCNWDNRAYTLEMIESEDVVSKDDTGSTIITEYQFPPCAVGSRTRRRRYHLKAVGDSWLICDVEDQCFVCRGQGDEGCIGCKGKHWLSSQADV